MRRRRRKVKSCFWCDRQLEKPTSRSTTAATKDHVWPKSRGGSKTVDCCIACNNIKGDMDPIRWRKFCDANPKWWTLYKSPILARVVRSGGVAEG